MRQFTNSLLIWGICIIIAGIFLGFYNYDTGCGSCGGVDLIYEPTLFLFKPIQNLYHSPLSAELCSVAGCSLPVAPIFMDIYLLGFILIITHGIRRYRTGH